MIPHQVESLNLIVVRIILKYMFQSQNLEVLVVLFGKILPWSRVYVQNTIMTRRIKKHKYMHKKKNIL